MAANDSDAVGLNGTFDVPADQPVRTKYEAGVTSAVVLIGIAGVIGNGVVMFVVYRAKQLHTITNYFVAHQALIDSISSFLMMYHYVIPIPKPPAGLAGQLICKLWAARFPMWTSMVASTYNLVFLTMERYIAIVFPFTYVNLLTPRRLVPIFVGTWVFAIFFNSPYLDRTIALNGRCLFVDPYTPVVYKLIASFSFIVQYFFPLLFMFFSYLHIILVITSKITGRVGPNADLPQAQQDSMSTARRNLIKTQILVCTAFAVLWAPNQIYYFIYNISIPADVPSYFHNVTVCIAYLNSCINPVIYGLKYKQFRNGVKVAFPCLGNRVHDVVF